MKIKRFILLTVLWIFVIALTACAPKTPEQLLKNAENQFNNARSVSLKTEIFLQSTQMSMDQTTVSTMDLFLKPLKGKIQTSAEGMDIEQYMEQKDGNITVYSNADGKWTSYSVPENDSSGNPMSFLNQLTLNQDVYTNLTDLGIEKEGNRQYRKLQADLNGDMLKEAVRQFGLLEQLGGEQFLSKLNDAPLQVIYLIDEKKEELSSITMDLTAMMNSMLSAIIPGGTGVTFEKLEMTTYVAELNNAKPFNIPDEAYQAEPVGNPNAKE